MSKLNDEQVRDGLSGLAAWERQGDEIVKEYKFDGFGGAIGSRAIGLDIRRSSDVPDRLPFDRHLDDDRLQRRLRL